MVDLATTYLGLRLRSPLVAGAAPPNRHLDTARRLEDAGAGAIVLPSLFEEEILAEELELHRSLEQGTEHVAEALGYFPAIGELWHAGDRYLEDVRRLKAAVDVPVVASLNATTRGAWVRYARLLEEAGADALEVNVYRVAADATLHAADVEAGDLSIVDAVRDAVGVPFAVKLSPYYTAFAAFAAGVVQRGADGLVLFNRFYQPDLDLETFDVVPRVDLSQRDDLRLPLRWIAILRPGLDRRAWLAASSGIHGGEDAVKAIAVGADVVQMTSALLRHGPGHLRTVEAELRAWLEEREYETVDELRGCATRATVADPAGFERANYMRTIRSWVTPPVFEAATAAPAPAATGPHGGDGARS